MPAPWPLPFSLLTPVSGGAVLWRRGAAPAATVIVKATFELVHGQPARLSAPLPIVCEDRYSGPEGSLVEASEIAPFLPNAGVILSGHAHAPGGRPISAMSVRLAIFRDRPILDKTLHVYGDRTPAAPSSPRPFLKMPIVYERAQGGPENPVGVCAPGAPLLPNIVDSRDPRRPAGFGPIAKRWPARGRLLGACDERALEQPVPEIPEDFDGRYFQPAPQDQQVAELLGDEWIVLDGLHPELPRIETRLPSVRAEARWHLASGTRVSPARSIELRADMLVIDADHLRCSLIWRGHFVLDRPDMLPWVRVFAGVERPGHSIRWPAELPIFLKPPVAELPAGLVLTRPVDSQQIQGATLPFVPADPNAPALEQHPRPPVVESPRELTGTTDFDLRTMVSAVLPFAPSGAATPADQRLAAAIIQPPVVEAPAGLLHTGPVDSQQIQGAALPFAPPDPNAPALEQHPRPPVVQSPRELTGTTDFVLQKTVPAVLPFAASGAANPAAPEPPPPPAPEAAPSPAAALPDDAATGVRGTVLARLRAGAPIFDIRLAGADLHDIDFSGASLHAQNLKGARLQRCIFVNACLTEAQLGGADLTDADLTGANLGGADLSRAVITRARLSGANARGASFSRVSGEGADFSGAILEGADLLQARLSGANFEGAILRDASASKADLTACRLKGADLSGAVVRAAKLTGADLSLADLGGADLREADLERADLRGARRVSARMGGAHTKDMIEGDPDAAKEG